MSSFRRVGVGYPRTVGYVGAALPQLLPPNMQQYFQNAQQQAGMGMPPPSGVAPVYGPPWRAGPDHGMTAPGTPNVQEGHVPLPLNPETNSGIFSATVTNITFSSRPQKPFVLTRLLVIAAKTGASATSNFLVGQVFVGTDLQQGELGNINLEQIGAANAFDTWVSFKQAEPGVWIRVQAQPLAALTGSDTMTGSIQALGHYLH
jgi:hypothetical protein